MPFIQIGSGLAEAGSAAASYQQMVGPAVQGLSQAMTNVQQLRQSAARDVAQQAMQQELMGVRRAQLALSEQEFEADQVIEQRRRASAEMAERTKLAAERGKLAEQARSLGFPVSEEGTAGLLAVLQQEDPDGFQTITSQFAEALPNGIENEEQVTALWRASADTLLQGRSMRAAADKQGRAAKVLTQIENGALFWRQEDGLELAALAEDPNVSAAEYRAAEEDLRQKRQAEYAQKAKVEAWGKRALGLFKEKSKSFSEEVMDRALSILGKFESGDVDDPEVQVLRLEAMSNGLENALGRVEETAFVRGQEVGRASAMSGAQNSFFQVEPANVADVGQQVDSEIQSVADAVRNTSRDLESSRVEIPAGSKLAQGLMSETQIEAMRIKAAMKAQGFDPTKREDFDKFMQAERARAEESKRAASQRRQIPNPRSGPFGMFQ